jgi:hypothetical protein
MTARIYTTGEVRRLVILGVLLFGAIEEAVLYFGFPAYCTVYTAFIPVYFLILGLTLLFALSQRRTTRSSKPLHPGRALARLMILNVSQLVLSAIILFLYIRYINVQRNTFLLVFAVYYIWFLGLKMFVLCNIDFHHQQAKETKKQTK